MKLLKMISEYWLRSALVLAPLYGVMVCTIIFIVLSLWGILSYKKVSEVIKNTQKCFNYLKITKNKQNENILIFFNYPTKFMLNKDTLPIRASNTPTRIKKASQKSTKLIKNQKNQKSIFWLTPRNILTFFCVRYPLQIIWAILPLWNKFWAHLPIISQKNSKNCFRFFSLILYFKI